MDVNYSNEILVKAGNPGSPLAIVFSSVNSNGFSFYNQFKESDLNIIFVRDTKDSWFQFGTGSETSSIESLADRLTEEASKLSPNRIVTFGASMGGYGAILFGNLLEVDAIIASSPQTIIDTRLPHTPKSDFSAMEYFDLAPLVSSTNGDRRHVIFIGCDDLVDLYNSCRLSWRQCQLLPVAAQDHLAAVLLTRRKEFERALDACARDIDYSPKVALDRRGYNGKLRRGAERLVESYYIEQDLEQARQAAEALVSLDRNWAGAHFILAEILAALGDDSAATGAAGEAVRLGPNSVTFVTYHANLLLKAGKFRDAILGFEAALRLRAKHYNALCGIAICEARLGNSVAAMAALDAAIDVRPRLARAQSLKTQIVNGSLGSNLDVGSDDM